MSIDGSTSIDAMVGTTRDAVLEERLRPPVMHGRNHMETIGVVKVVASPSSVGATDAQSAKYQ